MTKSCLLSAMNIQTVLIRRWKTNEKKSRPTVNEFDFNQCTVIVTIYFTDYFIFVPLGGWQGQQIWVLTQANGVVCTFHADWGWKHWEWENSNQSPENEAGATKQGQKIGWKSQACISRRVCSCISFLFLLQYIFSNHSFKFLWVWSIVRMLFDYLIVTDIDERSRKRMRSCYPNLKRPTHLHHSDLNLALHVSEM